MIVLYDVITQSFKAGHSASLILLFEASAKKWVSGQGSSCKPVHSHLHLYKVSTAESSSGYHSTVISNVSSLHFRSKWLSLLKTTAQEGLKYVLSDKNTI